MAALFLHGSDECFVRVCDNKAEEFGADQYVLRPCGHSDD
jgi:hypothetical protein